MPFICNTHRWRILGKYNSLYTDISYISDYLKEAIIRDFKSVEAMKDKVIAVPTQIPDSVQCLALASLHVKHL